MSFRSDIKKVLVLGSGPIIIGQAAEFDYAGTQACKALKEEGVEIVLINSNPATIMTDKNMADHVYIEPMTLEVVENIIMKEKPDSLLATLGGQVGLNLAMELFESGFLMEQNVTLIGTTTLTIKKAEDRQVFKDTMEKIGVSCIPSKVVENVEDALHFAEEIAYPVIIRPGYTMGGTGGGIAKDASELSEITKGGIKASRVGQVLIEKCISGWKEIEFETLRDAKGNKIIVCSMENIDPVGIHTGDSIVVAPAMTLSEPELSNLRKVSFDIIDELDIQGGCNVQFAQDPHSEAYAIIEVNPRLSRSSALASKATGFPIARIATKIALGYELSEIKNAMTGTTHVCTEPVIDYTVVKFPRFPFDKFVGAKRTIGTQMKATGEVMAIGVDVSDALMKAVRSLEQGFYYFGMKKLEKLKKEEILEKLRTVDDERFFLIAEALRKGIAIEEIHEITQVDEFFLQKVLDVIQMEEVLKREGLNEKSMREAKKMGFLDQYIAELLQISEAEVYAYRHKNQIIPSYKMVDTCAGERDVEAAYYYSTYDRTNEAIRTDKKKMLVIGSGPIRIGQGIEFDYCSVHSVWALKELGYETIIVNNNPETVSTDFDTSDRLYFEPLTKEDVAEIIENEKPDGVILQFGGQTAIKLANFIATLPVKMYGTSARDIDAAEDRALFDEVLTACEIRRPRGLSIYTEDEAIRAAAEIGYPVLLRPSYVLGGQGMEIAFLEEEIRKFMRIINQVKQEHPILIDKYVQGIELEVDAICDGEDILIPGIMEHIDRAGIHSGDSISVYPTQRIEEKHKRVILEYTRRLAKALHVIGLVNIQFILCEEEIYVIEVNPRSSRTVPYISKVTNIPMVNLAIKTMMGMKLRELGFGVDLYQESDHVAIKVPVFSFEKLDDVDTGLSPEMKSTGEVLGIAKDYDEALFKGLIASGLKLKEKGEVLITVRDTDKAEVVQIARLFEQNGYQLVATKNTACFLKEHGLSPSCVNKISEGKPDILDYIENERLSLVINTPTRGKDATRDGFKIRRKAVSYRVPCVTSLDTAYAIATLLSRGIRIQDLEMVDITKI